MTPTLQNLDVDRFLARTWQRRPLVVRSAFDPARTEAFGAIDAARLAALAASDDVESRLVRRPRRRGGWSLQHGPFESLPSRRAAPWTLLVQGVDLHDDTARALLDAFRFIPDARIDDLMCSLANDGGGVGPHVDSYDVFLIQLAGRREWSFAPPSSAHVPLAGEPVRVIAPFPPAGQHLLEPGDLLYLPPGWAHDGVARGPCITASVGFRAPSRGEILGAFHGWMADRVFDDGPRYRDPARMASAGAHPARLPEDLVTALSAWIRSAPPDDAALRAFIGSHLSEPKPQVWFDGADEPFEPSRGIRLHRATRMLYDAAPAGAHVFVNGETETVPAAARAALRRLADMRRLDGARAVRACQNPWLRALLARWWDDGWVQPDA